MKKTQPDPAQKTPVKYRKETRDIEVTLTDQEKLAYSKEMSEAVQNHAEATARLDSFKKQVNAQLSAYDATISSCSHKINTGREYRLIPCVLYLDYAKGEAYWVREDTGESFGHRAIKDEERQAEMEV